MQRRGLFSGVWFVLFARHRARFYSFADVALVSLGDDRWAVNDAGNLPSDGWMIDGGSGAYLIDDAASSGLTLAIAGGSVFIET